MTAIIVAPMDYIRDPKGILHLRDQHPDARETFCGELTGRKWESVDETLSGVLADCFTCRLALKRLRSGADALGNVNAQEGLDVCACGCKYWENDQCFDCGQNWHPSFREDEPDA